MSEFDLIRFPVIGIAGLRGAGKDYLAELLRSEIESHGSHQVEIVSFATPMSEALKAIFGWTDEQLQNRNFKERTDVQFGVSPRHAMQTLGTDWGRRMIHQDIWVNALESRIADIRRQGKLVIISDVRFDNEATMVQNLGGEVVEIVPDIEFEAARDRFDTDDVFNYLLRDSRHESDNRLHESLIDHTLKNDFGGHFDVAAISLAAGFISQHPRNAVA